VLHLSQPALSHQIAAIERTLGTPVIERRPRGTRPTVAGLAAAAEARVALAAADRMVIAGRRVAAGAAGRIRIACPEAMAAWLLAPVLRGWRGRHPAVELELTECGRADQLLDLLRAGRADLAVGPRPAWSGEHIELLGREEIVVIAAAGHRFADLDAVPPAELAAEPLIGHDGWAGWAGPLAARCGVTLPGPAVHAGRPGLAAQLAAAGLGVTIAPRSAASQLAEAAIRSLDPPERRDVVVMVAAPHDDLTRRFARDLLRCGLPGSAGPDVSRGGPRPAMAVAR
jgi:DNA-binding transcriptional LysR family regulator